MAKVSSRLSAPLLSVSLLYSILCARETLVPFKKEKVFHVCTLFSCAILIEESPMKEFEFGSLFDVVSLVCWLIKYRVRNSIIQADVH